MPIWLVIVTTAMGSTGLFAFLQYLISRHDNRKGVFRKILDKLDEHDGLFLKSEKDSIRTQLLLMITDYPEDKAQILELGEHYFKDLNGNWYLSAIFQNYLRDCNIPTPPWFNANHRA